MKIKTDKHGFTFDKETTELLNRIIQETDMRKSLIVKRGIELFAEKKGIK
jgi:hypothetical protein